MATKTKGRKPLNFFMCESVYTAIAVNLNKHKSTREAIYWFIDDSETFKALAEGKIHNDFVASMERNTPDKLLDYKKYNEEVKSGVIHQDKYTEMRKQLKEDLPNAPQLHDLEEIKSYMKECEYDYIEPETGEHFTKADMDSMIEERDRIMLEVARVADPADTSTTTSTGLSDRAYKQIWRMCESYEKYCLETNQPGPLPLNIIKK